MSKEIVRAVYDESMIRDFGDLNYAKFGDAGFDLRAAESKKICVGKFSLIKTGLCVEIPYGFELQIRSRSGLASKKGLFVLNSPGTIDSGYRGEIGVILANFGDDVQEISRGDKIAQAVLSEFVTADIRMTTKLSESERGDDGFGSTG